ncbi:MAG: NUDIX domain-containing protein [Candidatus Thermoplasmatota archaeon]|nr:NUDIX domain-containing protein [Candidatus Thermoplasmatota archaeon]MBS3790038.1 NUDIX domain-containing protein [Candidatus Thermoplasmatota archaeon]
MLEEVSAGVLVYREAETVKYLLLHYPAGHWDFPKGHVEEDESIEETALRELREETGIGEDEIDLKNGFKETIDYIYKKRGELSHKKVIYFLGKTEKKEVKISKEHQGYRWLPFQEAKQKVTFRNARKLLEKSKDFLEGENTKKT